jgi:hypothetical protein
MNKRLKEMGEKWTAEAETAHPPPASIQLSSVTLQKAHLVVSFYEADMHPNTPKTVILDLVPHNTDAVSISAAIAGDGSAEDLHIWIRDARTANGRPRLLDSYHRIQIMILTGY